MLGNLSSWGKNILGRGNRQQEQRPRDSEECSASEWRKGQCGYSIKKREKVGQSHSQEVGRVTFPYRL